MLAAHLQAFRLFNRDVRLVLLAYAFMGFSYVGIYVVLFNLYLLRLGYGPEFVGQVNAAARLAFALCSLPAGALGSRLGVRRLLIAGEVFIVLGLVGVPLGEFLPGNLQSGWILVTYVLTWGGAAVFFVNMTPFLMAAAGPGERSYAFSATAALIPLTGFAGSLVGGLLPGFCAAWLDISPEHPAAYRYPLLLAGLLHGLPLPALVATRPVGEERAARREEGERRAPRGLIAALSLVVVLVGAGQGAVITFFNVYLDEALQVSTALIGALSAAGQIASVPAALAMPLLASRWGHERLYFCAAVGAALCLLPLAMVPHWAAAGLGRTGMAALAALTGPALTVYHQGLVAPRWRATTAGSIMMASGLSWTLVSLAGGYLVIALGYAALFLVGAGLSAGGALLFYFLFGRVPRGEYARAPAPGAAD